MTQISRTERTGKAKRYEQWARDGVCCLPHTKLAIVFDEDEQEFVCEPFNPSLSRWGRFWGCVLNREKFVAISWQAPQFDEDWKTARDAMKAYYNEGVGDYDSIPDAEDCYGS